MSSSPDPELMQLFDFSVTDLNANRDGKITAYQLDHLREKLNDNWFALGCLPVAGFMCYLCWATFQYMSPDRRGPLPIPVVIGGGVLFIVGIIALCISAIRRSSAEVNNPRVQSIQGHMHVYMKQEEPFQLGGSPMPTLQIEQIEFYIKVSQYKGLSDHVQNTDEQKNYKVYYTEKTKTVLSIESLS